MKIAAIDIGTNAIKSKIFSTTPTSIEFLESKRTPMRLGTDVFKEGFLSEKKLRSLVNVLNKYKKYFEENEIKLYEIVATSAFRDTSNSEDARRIVENNIEHPIRIISGLEEAKLIRFHPKAQASFKKMYVDVGGGSTEFYMHTKEKDYIKSFQLGAVRNYLKMDNKEEWQRMFDWLAEHQKEMRLVGIGGNIRSFFKIYKMKSMTVDVFKKQAKELSRLNKADKKSIYGLNDDRVDVIDSAIEIYSKVISHLSISKVHATKWGVSDSTAVKLFHELYSEKIQIKNN